MLSLHSSEKDTHRPSEISSAPEGSFYSAVPNDKNIRKPLDFSSFQSVYVTTQNERRDQHDAANEPRGTPEVVRAISERLGSPAVYLRMPTCAYRIGDLTVERDGSIASDDGALLDGLRADADGTGLADGRGGFRSGSAPRQRRNRTGQTPNPRGWS